MSIILQEEEEVEIGQGGDKQSKGSSDGDATTGSYSSLEDDEAEIDHLAALAAKYQIDNVDLGNGNKICNTAWTLITKINSQIIYFFQVQPILKAFLIKNCRMQLIYAPQLNCHSVQVQILNRLPNLLVNKQLLY